MTLGTVFGVRWRIHPLFLALCGLALAGGQGRTAAILIGLLLTHELAHVLVARAYEVWVEEIELLPFGGLARMPGIQAAEPGVEALVALAGPLNNFFLLAAGVAGSTLWRPPGDAFEWYLWGNVSLACINLLPALPLDGGRIARGFLAPRLGYREATERLNRLGRLIGVALVLAGFAALLGGQVLPGLPVLGIFLWSAASRRLPPGLSMGEIQRLYGKEQQLRERRSMEIAGLAVLADVPVGDVCRLFRPGHYHLVWVLDGRLQTLGLVSEARIAEELLRGAYGKPIRDLLE